MKKFQTILFIISIFLFIGYKSFAVEFYSTGNIKLNSSSKLYGTTFATTFFLYSFAPDMLAGWNGPLYDSEKKYIPKKYHNIAILGGWWGNGNFPNKETLLNHKIDASFSIDSLKSTDKKMHEFMESINIPFISLTHTSMKDYADLYLKLGDLTGKKQRAKELADYINESLNKVNSVTKNIKKHKKVYLALSRTGLQTRCSLGADKDIIELAGGENVHKCSSDKSGQKVNINIEQIYIYDPDVIIVSRPEFYKIIKTDKKWQKLRAVKENNLILVSNEPFEWLEKQTFIRVFSMLYFNKKLYPEISNIDLVKEAQVFMKLFMDYNMDEKEALSFINPKVEF